MILTVDEFKERFTVQADDGTISRRLASVESFIRSYTRNAFVASEMKSTAKIVDGKIVAAVGYDVGDTLLVSHAGPAIGLFVVTGVREDDGSETAIYDVKPQSVAKVVDCDGCIVDLVFYPDDVVEGACELVNFDLSPVSSRGVKSLKVSRVSYTYEDATAGGYPASMLAFLHPYRKARV